VHFDSALNLVWLLFGLLALASTIRTRVLRARRSSAEVERSAPAWLHISGVALIVAALFPYISATDDVLRIEYFNVQHGQQSPAKPATDNSLMRLYETMDTPVVAQAPQIAFVLFFVALSIAVVVCFRSYETPHESGRSPPLLATA
jgi:hypothetical protein